MEILHFALGDLLEMKKPHPCGRDLTLPRVKLEKAVKRILPPDNQEKKD